MSSIKKNLLTNLDFARKKQPQMYLRSSLPSSKKSIKYVDKSSRCVLYSPNTSKKCTIFAEKYPNSKLYMGGGLLGGEASFAINTVTTLWFKGYEIIGSLLNGLENR